MSHAHSASFDSSLFSTSRQDTRTHAHPATLPLLEPLDLASYCTPLISHSSLAIPPPVSNGRYNPHPHPHSLTPPHRASYPGHASMASIGSVGSIGSISSLNSLLSNSNDQPTYPQSYSVTGTPYLHPTPLMHAGSLYDSPGQIQPRRAAEQLDGYGAAGMGGAYHDWDQPRFGRPHDAARGHGGQPEYESFGAALELELSVPDHGRAQLGGVGRIHPADGAGLGVLPEWRGYPYAQPGYGEAAIWGEMDEKMRLRRHVCPVCEKRFNRPSSLNTHMAVHTGAKPYKCPKSDCGRCFSVSSNLRRHMRTHHVREIKKDSANSRSPSTELFTTHPAPGYIGAASSAKTTSPESIHSAPAGQGTPEVKPAIVGNVGNVAHTSSAFTSLAPLTFPRSMRAHTRSTPAASLAPIGPIAPYTHNHTHSFSSFTYESATPSLGLGGSASAGSAFGLPGPGSGSGNSASGFGGLGAYASGGGSDTPLASGLSVLSFGSGTTPTGLDQYSLRRSSASVGGD